jgi:hypothetical protein
LSTCVVVIASDIFVNTADSGIARVNRAVGVIITNGRDVDVSLEAASGGIAILNLASVSIVAILLFVDTSVGDGIARVVGTHVVVITVLGSSNASSVRWIALVAHARNSRARNDNWIHAKVAWLSRISASSVRIADILGARIVVVAIHWSVGASHLRITSSSPASIWGSACEGGKDASSCWIAHVGGTSVSIVASDCTINTSISSNVGSATLRRASVTILTSGGTHTPSTARAETEAITTAGRPWNRQTSSLYKSIEDSLEGSEAGNGRI